MSDTNDAIADVLERLGTWEEVIGSVPFKVLAYRNAAEALRDLDRSVVEMVAGGEDLTQLESIGKGIAKRIEEIVETGHTAFLAQFEKEVGPGVFELLRIPGLGPKRVRTLRDQLGISSPEELRAAAEAGRIRELDGFGAKTEERLLRRVQRLLDDGRDSEGTSGST